MAQLGTLAALAARAGLLLMVAGFAPTPEGTGHRTTNPHAETDTYVTDMKAAGQYKSGAQGFVDVTLSPKGGYHINPEYPYKFKAADPPADGVTYPKPVLARADGAFDAAKGSFRVPFVPAHAGTLTVGGTLHLSVCSDANCVLDKVPLEVQVDVK